METIRISEIFGPTIQGEGAVIGQPTVFVRTGGCDYRCSWCDTMHAVDSKFRADWAPMTPEEIFARIEELSRGVPIMVTLSGGNPATQNLGPLITLGRARGYTFALETQGSVAQDWFADLDILTLSPKPPSSGMATDWGKLDEIIKSLSPACGGEARRGGAAASPPSPSNSNRSAKPREEFLSSPPQAGERGFPQVFLKLVVFDNADYDYAKSVAAKYPQLPVYLQPGNHAVNGDADIAGLMARMHWLIEKTITDQWYAATVLPQLHVLLWGNKRGV